MTLIGTVAIQGRCHLPGGIESEGEAGVVVTEALDRIAIAGCLLAPEEADKLADLIREAVAQCRGKEGHEPAGSLQGDPGTYVQEY